MIDVTELRSGIVFEDANTGVGPWMVIKYEHVKMGRGSATIKVKIKNLKSGTIIEKSYTNGARMQDVTLEKRKGQFLYKDTSGFVFMDPGTYEEFSVREDLIGDQGKFLKEGTEVDLKFYQDEPISIVLPLKMNFTITDTDPGVKGNTVSNVYKEATIDTGAKIKVPLFVNAGEEVVVNTDTGEYVERTRGGK